VCVCIRYVLYVAALLQLCCSSVADLIAVQDGGGCVCVYTLSYVSIRQHPSASVSVLPEQQAGVCVCIRYMLYVLPLLRGRVRVCVHSNSTFYVSIRQHTSAYVSIRQYTSVSVSILHSTSAYVSIRHFQYLPT
jgi:hypothetical protein